MVWTVLLRFVMVWYDIVLFHSLHSASDHYCGELGWELDGSYFEQLIQGFITANL